MALACRRIRRCFTMRPRYFAADNAVAPWRGSVPPTCFNEAAAPRRGQPEDRSKLHQRFDDASMRPRHFAADKLIQNRMRAVGSLALQWDRGTSSRTTETSNDCPAPETRCLSPRTTRLPSIAHDVCQQLQRGRGQRLQSGARQRSRADRVACFQIVKERPLATVCVQRRRKHPNSLPKPGRGPLN